MVHPRHVKRDARTCQTVARRFASDLILCGPWLVGLSGALETLCGQGFGTKLYKMLGIYLQSASIISIFFSVLVAVLWWYTEPTLTLLHQNYEIWKATALYMKYLIPGIFAYGLLQNILRILQTQSVVLPLVVCSLLPLILHIVVTYALVHLTGLRYKGAPLAAAITLWISVLMLAGHVSTAKKFEQTWTGLSMESFKYVFPSLKLALPSAAMICVNTEAIAYMFTYALSAAASLRTRVSNELGAGNPEQAKHTMGVTIKLSVLLAILVIAALGFGHNLWASFSSDSPKIISEFACMTLLLVVSIFFDAIQGVLSGDVDCSIWPCTRISATFYLIGTPIACLLGFKFKLYAKGLWIGLICGLGCQAGALFLITYQQRWTNLEPAIEETKTNPV
ncbi:hypothetical protein Droror1_Dr00020090 [Drosera rotundifolia]